MPKYTQPYSQADIDAALEACAREPVHVPGAIQPKGCLLSLSAEFDCILQVSANVEQFLNVSAEEALACRPEQLLGADLLDQLRAAAPDGPPSRAKLLLRPPYVEPADRLWLTHYRSGDRIVIELELAEQDEAPELAPARNDRLHPINAAQTPQDLMDTLTRIVSEMTGFERVMIYRFDVDDHGSVVAETCAAGVDPYLGHHFPASDIPAQVRQLYRVNEVRSIPDAQAAAVPLVPELDPVHGGRLDLSRGNLRAVSPIHLQYLANMGVASSLSVAIHNRGRLWGLVACHGLKPRTLAPALREDIAVLVQVAASRLFLLQAHQDAVYLQRIRGSRELLLSRQPGALPSPEEMLERYGHEWLALFEAEGMAVLDRDKTLSLGHALPPSRLRCLVDELMRQSNQELWSTSAFGASPLKHCYAEGDPCGVLAVRLPVGDKTPGWVMFFRPEQAETRTWAGRPEDIAVERSGGGLTLSPRQSFRAWQEVIRGASQPWTEVEKRAATDLGEDLAVLVFSRRIDQLNASLTEANRRLQQLAQTDALTGLPNRRLLEDRVENSIARAQRHGQSLALLFLDLDRFKQVNDALGHRAGDQLIREVAQRLSRLVRDSDTVARLGGDEFAVLLDETSEPEDAGVIADKVLAAFADPFDLEGHEIFASFSMGISRFPADGDSFRSLMHNADMAMYQAKRRGRSNYQFYSAPAQA